MIGGVVGAYRRPPIRAIVVAQAFASGTLITALAHDLFVTASSSEVLLSGMGF